MPPRPRVSNIRIDYLHGVRQAVQHLAAVGRAIYGEDQQKLKNWLKPLVRQLKNQSAVKVIGKLEELLEGLPQGASAQAVKAELNYLREHQDRMDYRRARLRGEPIGSGAVESTCRQTQCRFKRPGQYWTLKGDEALLCLEMFWRNNRWDLLFPHVRLSNPSKN